MSSSLFGNRSCLYPFLSVFIRGQYALFPNWPQNPLPLHPPCLEIHQQTDIPPRSPKVVNALGHVLRPQPIRALQLHHQFIIYHQIREIAPHALAFMNHVERNLHPNRNPFNLNSLASALS